MSRRLTPNPARLAALAVTGGLLLSLASLPADAAPTDDPSTAPSGDGAGGLVTYGIGTAANGRPDDRPYIMMTATPGSTVYEQVAVYNQSNVPLDLDVYAADAVNTASGSLGLPVRSVQPTDVGSWITLGAAKLSVPPQSSTAGVGVVTVPVTVAIPADAEPGDHLAGILTSLTASGAAGDGATGATVDLEQRVAVRVYVTVDGDLHPGLRVSRVQATYHPAKTYGLAGLGSATVSYTLTNTGNVRLTVDPTVTASGIFGLAAARAAGKEIEELLPRSSVSQTVEVPAVWPMILDHVQVQAAVTLPTDKSDAGIGSPSDSTWMWAIPWAHLALIALIALAWWWLRRRTEQRRAGRGRHSHDTPAAPAATPDPHGREVVGARSPSVP